MATRKRTTKATRTRKAKPKGTSRRKPPSGGDGFRGRSALAMILYGPPGVGKTSFAAQFPNVGFIHDRQEEGVVILEEYGQIPKPKFVECVESFDAMLSVSDDVARGDTGVGTIVYDSFTGFEKLIFQSHCEEYYNGDWSKEGFYSYSQGPKNAAKTDVPKLLNVFDDIRQAGINVIILAHSTVKPYANPEGADYDRYIADMDKATWGQIHRWAKAVVFYNYFVEINEKGTRNKARSGSEERYLYSSWSPAYDAKNQYGLEPIIDAGASGEEAYQAFCDAFDAIGKT